MTFLESCHYKNIFKWLLTVLFVLFVLYILEFLVKNINILKVYRCMFVRETISLQDCVKVVREIDDSWGISSAIWINLSIYLPIRLNSQREVKRSSTKFLLIPKHLPRKSVCGLSEHVPDRRQLSLLCRLMFRWSRYPRLFLR